MDNEALVDQINRCLSFEVVAVPEDIFQTESTSKVTPLNVKIKVRKKNDTGLRHGVITMPKVDNRCEKRPERIRLVSSDQTIMSFNVEMEAVFDKIPQKHHNQNLNLTTTDQRYEKDTYDEPKKDENYNVTHNFSKRNKDLFGKCKPGGCLDPPFSEEKYAYKPSTPGARPPAKNDPTKLKSSSIFKNKLFSRKKRSSQSSDIIKADHNTEKINSVQSLQEHVSLSSTNSIITYPHPSSSSDIRISEDKSYRNRFSSENKSKNSVEDNSYFILPKKSKNSDNRSTNGNTFPKETLANELIKRSDEHFLQTSQETNKNSSNLDLQAAELINKKNKNVVQTTTKLIDNNILKVESQIYKWIKSGDNNTLQSSKTNHEGNTIKTQFDQSELDKPILPISVECRDDKSNILSLESQSNKFDKLGAVGTLLATANDNNRSKTQIPVLLAEESSKLGIENEIPRTCSVNRDDSNIINLIPQSNTVDKPAYNNNDTFFNTGDSNNDETRQSEESTTKKGVPNRIDSKKDDRNTQSLKLQSNELNKLETDNTCLSIPGSNNIDRNIPNSGELDKPGNENNVTTDTNYFKNNDSIIQKLNAVCDALHEPDTNDTLFNTAHFKNENSNIDYIRSDHDVSPSNKSDKYKNDNIVPETTFLNNYESSIREVKSQSDLLKKAKSADFDKDYNNTLSLKLSQLDELVEQVNRLDNVKSRTGAFNDDNSNIQNFEKQTDELNKSINKIDISNTTYSQTDDRNLNPISHSDELHKPDTVNTVLNTSDPINDTSNDPRIGLQSDDLDKSATDYNRSNSSELDRFGNEYKPMSTDLNNYDNNIVNVKSQSGKIETLNGNIILNSSSSNNNQSLNLESYADELNKLGHQNMSGEDLYKTLQINKKEVNVISEDLNVISLSSVTLTDAINNDTLGDLSKTEIEPENINRTGMIIARTDSYTNNNLSDTLETNDYKNISQKNLTSPENPSSLFNNMSSAVDKNDLIVHEPTDKKLNITDKQSSDENIDTTNLEQINNIENAGVYDIHQTKSSIQQEVISVVGMNDMEGVNEIEKTTSIIETGSATEVKSTPLVALERRESMLDVTKEISNPVFHGRASYSNTDYESFNSSSNDLTEIWENESAAPTSAADVIAIRNINKGILQPIEIHKLSDLPETNVNKEISQSTSKAETDSRNTLMSTEDGVNLEKKSSKLDPSENQIISEDGALQNFNGADTGMKKNIDSSISKDMIYAQPYKNLLVDTDYCEENENVSLKLSNTAPIQLNEDNPALKTSQKKDSSNDACLEGNYTVETDNEMVTLEELPIFQDGKAPWKVNLALRSYIDENNDRVIKSYDSENISERRKRDTLIVAQCFMGAETNELKVPIDGENDLRLQITNKKFHAAIFTDTSVQTDANPEFKKIELHLAKSKYENIDLKEKLTVGERNVCSKVKQNAIIQENVRNSLNKIYEQELLPLQDTIKGLREEIESLAVYEMKFRENVHKLIPKKTRPLRLVPSNRRCACNRK